MDERALPRAFGALAPGWVPVKDQASGDTYYWNQLTNDTTWDRPVAEEPPPAPEGLPYVCRASTNRSVVVAPGAAAAAAARTRTSASISRQGSPKCSASASHCSTSSSGLLSPLRDGPEHAHAATPPPFTALPPAATPTSAASVSGRASARTPASVSASSRSALNEGANGPTAAHRSLVDGAGAAGARAAEREPAEVASRLQPRAGVDSGLSARAAAVDAAAEPQADESAPAKPSREPPRAQAAAPTPPSAARSARGGEARSPGASASVSRRASGASQAPPSAAAEPAPDASWRAALDTLRARTAPTRSAAAALASSGLASLVASVRSAGAGGARGRPDSAASAPAIASGAGDRAGALAQLLGKPATAATAAAADRAAADGADRRAAEADASGGARLRAWVARLGGLDRWLLLRALALLSCLLFCVVVAVSAVGAAAGGRGARRELAASPPRALAVGMHTASLEWAQRAPRGSYAVAYELEVRHGGKGGAPLVAYAGLADARELSGLPESAALCARVRLVLRAEVSGEAVRSVWSACTVLHTTGRTAPAPPVLELDATSDTALAVRWAAPAANGGAVSRVQLARSEWRLAQVHSCAWTGPTCALGCAAADDARDPAPRTQNGSRLAAVWEHCAGANAVGCCGPFCWCYDRQCCTPSSELSERLDAVVLELPATDARAELDVRDAAAARPLSVRARAFNPFGWSGWGPALRVQTDAAGAAAPEAMAAPAFRTAPTAAWLGWLAPAPNGAAVLGYELKVSARDRDAPPAAGAGALDGAGRVTVVGNVSSALLEQLEPRTAYLVAVRARNSRGAGAWSEPVALTTREMDPPPPPALLAVESRFSDALQLSWAAVRAETATVVGYELQWAPASNAREPAWRAGCGIGVVDSSADAAAELARDASGALREALRSPQCALSGLPIRSSVSLRARTRSLAGWGPWGARATSETLELKPCGSHGDQQRVWSGAFGKQLQTCSADCWGQPPCVMHCLQAIEMSVGCARCFGTAIACTKNVCHSSCSWSPVSNDCRECAAKSCWPALSACAGSPLPADVL